MFLVSRKFPAYSSAADRKLLNEFSELIINHITVFSYYTKTKLMISYKISLYVVSL